MLRQRVQKERYRFINIYILYYVIYIRRVDTFVYESCEKQTTETPYITNL